VSGAPSPYDHITAVIYPDWAAKGENRQAKWAADCTNEQCTGVPIYRQYLTGTKGKDAASSTREWVTWVGNDCDKLMNEIRDRSRPWVNPSDKFQPTVDPDFIATTRNATFHSPALGLMQVGRVVPAPECEPRRPRRGGGGGGVETLIRHNGAMSRCQWDLVLTSGA
jgi:hypothetical protein